MNKMKKFFTLFFIASTALYAAPVGNTSFPEIIQTGFFTSHNNAFDLRFGYEGDFVADARMGQYNQGSGRVDCYEQYTNSATVTLNLLNRMDVYAVLGGSETKVNWRFESLVDTSITRINLETNTDLLWAVGSRVILFEWSNASLGVGGRYSSCDYSPQWVTSNGTSVSVSGARFNWDQWQVNLDFSYKINIFTPYIGTKYSSEKAELSNFSVPISQSLSGENTFENRIPVGLYLGCALSNGKYFMLNLEGRLIDEEAVTVSCDFRF